MGVAARFFILCAITSARMNAEVIGIEGFDYPNGSISGRVGGSGWNQSGSVAPWAGDASIDNGLLQTTSTAFSDTSAARGFGGNEATSALPTGTGVFFRVQLTLGPVIPDESLLTLFHLGTEIVAFGHIGPNWVIRGAGNIATGNAASNTTTLLIVGLDYANDRFFLFLDPNSSDFYSRDGGTADLKQTYNGADSLTRFSLASMSTRNAGAKWDNVAVATTFEEAIAIPEPKSLPLLLLGAALLYRVLPRRLCADARPEDCAAIGERLFPSSPPRQPQGDKPARRPRSGSEESESRPCPSVT